MIEFCRALATFFYLAEVTRIHRQTLAELVFRHNHGGSFMSFDFNRWIRQPSTLHGLGVIAAGVGVVLTHVTTGSPVWDGVVAATAYAGVHLGIDDNSALEQDVEAVAGDAAALAQGKPPTPAMVADAVKTLQAAADALVPPAPKAPAGGAASAA